jgi:hypothetical protein
MLLTCIILAVSVGCPEAAPPTATPSVPSVSQTTSEVTKPVSATQESNSDAQANVSPKKEPIDQSTKSQDSKLVAPAADAKPKELPLDETVNVDGLLAMRLPTEELGLGWIRLFDGQSMTGWRNEGNANWRVEDGVLVANTGNPGLLCTSVRFSDFELMLEYKGTDTTNSGVFLRTPAVPKDPAKDCYELNIAPPDNPFPTGSLVSRVKVSEQIDEPESGEWHSLHALLDRDRIQVWVNGVPAADHTDTTGLTAGLIGLQFREGTIRFRNIMVRPITYAVLPAKDLKDFNEPAGSIKAELSEAGSLTMTGGKGHMELLQPHANFCVQTKVLTLAPNVNSGLFFRCIPGEDMNGYECQIHHGFKEDRRRAVDAGIGAIFRRKNAKAVLSDEGQPAFVTVVADGKRISTWVNGIQVVDFEDERAPNDNPRKGLRTEAGTIMLQAHDPECKVRFESLSICPLP